MSGRLFAPIATGGSKQPPAPLGIEDMFQQILGVVQKSVRPPLLPTFDTPLLATHHTIALRARKSRNFVKSAMISRSPTPIWNARCATSLVATATICSDLAQLAQAHQVPRPIASVGTRSSPLPRLPPCTSPPLLMKLVRRTLSTAN